MGAGGGDRSPVPARELDLACAVGRGLASAGAVLLCGGLEGVMEAACEGAHAAGGLTVGLLAGDDRSAANPYVGVALATGLGELRNGLIVRASDAVIAIGGGWGTLSEIAFAMRTGRPVVALSSWEDALAAHREARRGAGRTHGGAEVHGASGPDEAVRLALELAARP